MLAPSFQPEKTASNPLVSVIIAVYQGERLIVGAVRSALAQSYHHLEIIVVDDGSTDGTAAALIDVHDPRLRVISQPNAGTASARNTALAEARGQYIAFLDADDRWFPNKLEVEVDILRNAPGPAVVYSSFFAIDDDGRLLRPGSIFRASGNVFGALLDGNNFLVPSMCLLDRAIFDAIGMFDTARYHEDFDLFLRATRRFPAYPSGERLGLFRHSLEGKCRGILADFDRARREEVELVDGLVGTLTDDEIVRLRKNAFRALYERFLTYGYTQHARRLQSEVDLSTLKGSMKGRLAIFFARTGINVLSLTRRTLNATCRVFLSRRWQRRLQKMKFDVAYES